MLIALSSRRAKKKVIGLKGSSYNNQEFFDITNANELIKILGMILFTYCHSIGLPVCLVSMRVDLVLSTWLICRIMVV